MSDDAPKMTLVERTREIAKTVGLLHAETIRLRNAGLPPKFLGSLAAVEKALATLADQNAALSEAATAKDEPAPSSDKPSVSADEPVPADMSVMKR